MKEIKGFWFLALLVVAGSFCLTLVQLSKGLQEELLLTKQQLFDTRKALMTSTVDQVTLLEKQLDQDKRVIGLREKSALLSSELLEQQKKVKLLQYQLLAAREEYTDLQSQFSESVLVNEKQFNVTMKMLVNRIVSNREYSVLLKKHLQDRVTLERSLEYVQNKLHNSTNVMKVSQKKMEVAVKTIGECKKDNEELSSRLRECNSALTDALSDHSRENQKPVEN